MNKNIAILANSNSGKGKGLLLLQKIESYLYTQQITYWSFIDKWTDTLEKYSEVWVIGGDGTVNYFINKYPNLQIPFTIFKGGTGNDVAFTLYGNISWQTQVQQVLQGNIQPIDAGSCNNKLFLNGIGIGFDGEILQQMKSIRFIGGHLGYLLVVIKKIFSFKEHLFHIQTHNINSKNKYLLVSIFNGIRTGGGFYIAPKANMQDGLLDLVLCQPLSTWKRLKNLPVIEKGKHLKIPFIQYHQLAQININTMQIVPAQIDGELFYAKEFNIEVKANQFRVLV